MKLEVGEAVLGENTHGQPMRAVISAVEGESVLLDHNHPLAGKDLNFEVELVEVSRVKE
jgi:peptidylprolyl isomerase